MKAPLLALLMAAPAAAQDFTPGRPGDTDSAIPVAPGRFQVESELFGWARVEPGVEAWSVVDTVLRYGVARGIDVELGFAPYVAVEGPGFRDDGVSDLLLRVRFNLAGLEEGPAFAIIPFLNLPTSTLADFGARHVEGGITLAAGFDIAEGWDLTFTLTGAAISREIAGTGALVEGGVALGHALDERTGVYVEFFAARAEAGTAAVVNLGITRLLGPETQIDANVGIGAVGDADAVRVSLGLARRF